MSQRKITIKCRGKTYTFDEGTTKADIARHLFAADPVTTSNDVSKAVPMAYSQAMTIRAKLMGAPAKPTPSEKITKRLSRDPLATPRQREQVVKRQGSGFKVPQEDLEIIAKRDIPTARQLAKNNKQKKAGITARVGKLRTPGHASDIDVGPCVNCDHDVVVRNGTTGYTLVHVNTTAEEYLAVTQFCNAVPQALLQ